MITGVITTGDLTPLKEFGRGLIQRVLAGITENGPKLLRYAFKIASDVAGNLYQAFRDTLDNFGLLEGFDSFLAGVSRVFAGVSETAARVFPEVRDTVINAFERIRTALAPAMEFLSNLFSSLVSKVGDYISSGRAAEDITNVLSSAVEIFGGVLGFTANILATVVEKIADFVGWLSDSGISGVFADVCETAMRVFPEVRDTVINAFERIRTALAPVVEILFNLLSGFGEYISSGDAANTVSNILSSAIEILGKTIEIAADFLATVVEKISAFIVWLSEGGTGADLFAASVAGVVAAFAAFRGALAINTLIGSFQKAIEGAQLAFKGFNAVMAANPLILAATLVAGVTAALVVLWNTNEDFRHAVIGIWQGIKDGIAAAWEGIKKASSAAWEFIKGVFSAVGGFFKGVWNTIVDFLTPVLEAVKAAFSLAWTVVKGVWSVATAFFGAIWEGIKIVFSVAAPVFEAIFSAAWETVKGIWSVAVFFFETVWGGIKFTFSVAEAVIGGFFSTAWAAVKLVWNAATGYFENIWNTVAGIFSAVESVLKGDFSGAWTAIQNVFSGWGDYFDGLWNDLTNVFSNAFDWFRGVGENIVNGLIEGVGGLWDGFLTLIGLKTDEVKEEFTGPEGFDEHSPSKWSEDVFRRILEGGEIGFDKGLPGILSSAEGAAQDIRDMLAIDPLRVGGAYSYAKSPYQYDTPQLDAVTAYAAPQLETVRAEQPIQLILDERGKRILGEWMYHYIKTQERARG